MKYLNSEIFFQNKLPQSKDISVNNSILFYDKKLKGNLELKKWILKFPFSIGLNSGESLKSLEQFSKNLNSVISISAKMESRPLQFVALGGGSVGDFVGYMASVFKRGVDLIHVPSTYLAAMDSTHGGKNALNVMAHGRLFKNQIGTFYPAKKIFICKEIFKTLPENIVLDAYGEAIKISLLNGGTLWSKISALDDWNHQIIWKHLPDLVAAKYKIIKRDPFERNGIRHLLNFGHTIGHVIESELSIGHGLSVLLGLGFSLEWGAYRKITKRLPIEIPDHRKALSRLRHARQILGQDKKMTGKSEIRFVFLRAPGKPVIEKVKIDEIISELRRQIKR